MSSTRNGRDLTVDGTKLDGVATSATVNDTDTNLKARANHTGTQTASTISDFDATVTSSTHAGLTNNPHTVTKAQVGLTNVADLKPNLAGTVAPTANEDSGDGYTVGSIWVDTTGDKAYICVDGTAAGANWPEITSGITGDKGLQWQGAWSGGTTYVIDDAISSGGNSYICILGHTNFIPPNATYWELLASIGDVGPAGAGETNTASSDGGTSLVKTKVGVNMPFKGLTATSTKIALVSNTNDVGIDVTEANLTLGNLGGTLAITKGGTGQTAQTAAFDALAPTTSKGDIIVRNASNNIRVAVGTNDQVLIADSAQASGIKWATAGSGFTVDAQHATSTTITSTTSTTYVDLNTMTLTTSNTASTTYQITFSCVLQNTSANKKIYFILNVDGADLAATERRIGIKSAAIDYTLPTSCLGENLVNAKVIKIRYKTEGGTLSVYERVLTIYGVY